MFCQYLRVRHKWKPVEIMVDCPEVESFRNTLLFLWM